MMMLMMMMMMMTMMVVVMMMVMMMVVTSTEQEIIRVAPRPTPITSRSTITVGGSGKNCDGYCEYEGESKYDDQYMEKMIKMKGTYK